MTAISARHPKLVALGIIAVALAAALAFAGYRAIAAITYNGPTSMPSCTWPLHVRGAATSAQAGLVRCYLQAEAHRDITGLQAVAEQPVKLGATQLGYTADTRAGTATARFIPNWSDSAYKTVKITYGNGATSSVAMVLANAQSAQSWRLQIGTTPGSNSHSWPPTSPHRGPAPPSPHGTRSGMARPAP